MYKNSKFTILLPTVIACSLAAGMLLGSFLLRSGADRPARRAALSVAGTDKLNMLLRLIDAQYVDTVRMDSLTEEIIPLILENLDRCWSRSSIPTRSIFRHRRCRRSTNRSKANSTASA